MVEAPPSPADPGPPSSTATELRDPAGSNAARRILRYAGTAVALLVVLVAAGASYLLIEEKRRDFLADFEGRLIILAEGRADVIATWLEESAERTDRIVNSDLFRLFATEVDLSLSASDQEGSVPALALDEALLEQVPFMERVLSDFVSGAEFSAGYLLARDLGVKVSNTAAKPLDDAQIALAAQALDSQAATFGGLYETEAGLQLDMALPVAPAQAGSERPVGVMLFSMPVAGRLAELLGPRPGSQPGDTVRLLQVGERGLEALFPGQADAGTSARPRRSAHRVERDRLRATPGSRRRTGRSIRSARRSPARVGGSCKSIPPAPPKPACAPIGRPS